MHLSKNSRLVLGVVVSLLFLAAAFYKVRFVELWESLQSVNLIALTICLSFFLLSCLLRAVIWHITTRQLKPAGFSTLFGGVMVGYMANNLLPVRAGELVRAYYLARCTGISCATAFSTVCIERVLDLFSLGLLLVAGLFFQAHGLAPHTAKATLLAAVLALFSGTALFVTLARLNNRAKNESPISLFTRIQQKVAEFLEPVFRLRQPKTLAILILLSLLAWAGNYVSFLALVWDTPASALYAGGGTNDLQAALVLLLFVNLGLLIPSTPGALGIMQVAFWAALAPFGIAKEHALALSFAYQGGLYLLTLSVGMTYCIRSQFKVASISRKEFSASDFPH